MRKPTVNKRVQNLIDKMYPSKNLTKVQYNSVKKFLVNTKAMQAEIKKIQLSRSYKRAKDVVYPIPITLYMTKQEMKKYLKKKDLDIIIPINTLFEEKPKEVKHRHIIPTFLFNESNDFENIETYLQSKGMIITYENIFNSDTEFKNNIITKILNILIEQLSKLNSFKVTVSAYADFRNFDNNYQQGNIQLKPVMIKSRTNIDNYITSTISQLYEEILQIPLVESSYIFSSM